MWSLQTPPSYKVSNPTLASVDYIEIGTFLYRSSNIRLCLWQKHGQAFNKCPQFPTSLLAESSGAMHDFSIIGNIGKLKLKIKVKFITFSSFTSLR